MELTYYCTSNFLIIGEYFFSHFVGLEIVWLISKLTKSSQNYNFFAYTALRIK